MVMIIENRLMMTITTKMMIIVIAKQSTDNGNKIDFHSNKNKYKNKKITPTIDNPIKKSKKIRQENKSSQTITKKEKIIFNEEESATSYPIHWRPSKK